MKTLRLLLPALLGPALLLAAPCAFAADEPPPFGASDLALEAEGLDDGWEIVYEDPPGTLGEEKMTSWIEQIATSSGIDEEALLVEIRLLQGPDDASATVAVVEIDGDPKSFPDTLEQRGRSLGYVIRPLGHASRLLVIEAPETVREAIEQMQLKYAVTSLSNLGFERLDAGSQLGAIAFAKGAQAIHKKAGAPLVLLGMAAVKLEKWEDAVEAFRAGFKAGVPAPAQGRLAMRGNAFYGFALLEEKDKEKAKASAKEAVKALERAVALEGHADKKDTTFATRHNLARAHALAGNLDKAYEQLAKALEMAKIHLGEEGLRSYIKSRVLTADEWKSVKDDSAFKAVLQRATGDDPDEDEEGL